MGSIDCVFGSVPEGVPFSAIDDFQTRNRGSYPIRSLDVKFVKITIKMVVGLAIEIRPARTEHSEAHVRKISRFIFNLGAEYLRTIRTLSGVPGGRCFTGGGLSTAAVVSMSAARLAAIVVLNPSVNLVAASSLKGRW